MEVKVTPVVPKVVEYEVKVVLNAAEFNGIRNEYEFEEIRKAGTLDFYPFPFPTLINRLLRGIIGR